MIRVAHEGTVVSLTVSEGHPAYAPADASTPDAPQHNPDLLPWDYRNPLDPESTEMRTEPLDLQRLDGLPFSEARQLELTRTFLGTDGP